MRIEIKRRVVRTEPYDKMIKRLKGKKIEIYKGYDIFLAHNGIFEARRNGGRVLHDTYTLLDIKEWINKTEKKKTLKQAYFRPDRWRYITKFESCKITSVSKENGDYNAQVTWKDEPFGYIKTNFQETPLSSLIKPTSKHLVEEINIILKIIKENERKIDKLEKKLEYFKPQDFGWGVAKESPKKVN